MVKNIGYIYILVWTVYVKMKRQVWNWMMIYADDFGNYRSLCNYGD